MHCDGCRYFLPDIDDCLLEFEGACDADGEAVDSAEDVCMCEDRTED